MGIPLFSSAGQKKGESVLAAYVGDTEEEATEAANAKEDCRSDDPEHCRVHGTPLKKPSSYPKQWKPLTVRMETTAEQAREKLRAGISAKDPLGNDLTLDESIVRHWEEEGKTPQDINNRLSYLPVIEQSIRTPAEIWEAEDGTRVYMAAYHTRRGNRIYPLSFTVNKDRTRIRTYYPNEGNIRAKRRGKLLYEATGSLGRSRPRLLNPAVSERPPTGKRQHH